MWDGCLLTAHLAHFLLKFSGPFSPSTSFVLSYHLKPCTVHILNHGQARYMQTSAATFGARWVTGPQRSMAELNSLLKSGSEAHCPNTPLVARDSAHGLSHVRVVKPQRCSNRHFGHRSSLVAKAVPPASPLAVGPAVTPLTLTHGHRCQC
jgi:hypothetical protein